MTATTRDEHILGGIVLLAVATIACLPAARAAANDRYEFAVANTGNAVVTEQASPRYPGGDVPRGQEGWVRVSFVVTPDGTAIDPVILNSSGGAAFEREARNAVSQWRFESAPKGQELTYNIADIRSEIRHGKDAARSKFVRRTKHILTYLYEEENGIARKRADIALKTGGWNLYESTMLWLMLGRVEGAEGDSAGKLEMYDRSLALANKKSIPGKQRVDLLENIFVLQSTSQHFAAARQTFATLKQVKGSEHAIERLTARADKIQTILANDNTVTANATIATPCDCDLGVALWQYQPARRIFSFESLIGNVERFEARCERQRISDTIEPGKTWALAPEWGACRVLVFGDDGATFDFLEHLASEDDNATPAKTAVAGAHVPN